MLKLTPRTIWLTVLTILQNFEFFKFFFCFHFLSSFSYTSFLLIMASLDRAWGGGIDTLVLDESGHSFRPRWWNSREGATLEELAEPTL